MSAHSSLIPAVITATGTRTSRTLARADYGWDDPRAPIGLAAGGLGALVFDAIGTSQRWGLGFTIYFGLLGACLLAGALLYAYVTRQGKHAVWRELLDALPWRGDESVLDLGCGRGTVLIKAAGHVPNGLAIGVDIWDAHDQSGNSSEATVRNAELEGVARQTRVQTADIRALPFEDQSFDLVLSSVVIHNIHSKGERRRILVEAIRVLRPGGMLLLVDILHIGEYQTALTELGMLDVKARGLGYRMWYGNPVLRGRLIRATRSPEA